MQFVYNLVILIEIYAVLAVGLDITVGLGGIFVISQAAFYGVGAYATAVATTQFGFGFIPALLFSIALTALVGALVALPMRRVGGEYMVIATLAIQVIANDLFMNLVGITNGPMGITGIPAPEIFGHAVGSNAGFLILYLLIVLLAFAVRVLVGRSSFGLVLKGIRDDSVAVASLGKSVDPTKIKAMALSAGLAGGAGCLFAFYVGYVSPYTFTIEESTLILAMVILGGASTAIGPMLGAGILIALPELLRLLPIPNTILGPLEQI
ncbi:MAG: branched-chain amino acid ABC transporter permease, partial [Candidimonas sp.]